MARSTGPFNNPSPTELQSLINSLREFRNAYVTNLNATLPSVMAGEHVGHSAERTEVLRMAVKAEQAVNATGLQVGILPPPVAVGKAPLMGLTSVAFAHEDPVYRAPLSPVFSEDHKQGYDIALDAIDMADAYLCRMLEDEQRRRRKPTYWVDRLLRAILVFPAYLLSLAFGFDIHSLSQGKAQVLWLFSLAADAAGIYGLGVTLGWW